MSRVSLDMTMMDALEALAEGNPGAISVCMQLMEMGKESGFLDVLRLDDAGIYGPNVWIAYKDICGEDIEVMRERLRSGELMRLLNDNEGFQYYKSAQRTPRL